MQWTWKLVLNTKYVHSLKLNKVYYSIYCVINVTKTQETSACGVTFLKRSVKIKNIMGNRYGIALLSGSGSRTNSCYSFFYISVSRHEVEAAPW